MSLDAYEREQLDKIEQAKVEVGKLNTTIAQAEQKVHEQIAKDVDSRPVPLKPVNPYAFETRERLDRLFEAGFRKLGLDYWTLQKIVADEDQAEQRLKAEERAQQTKRGIEQKRQQLETNQRDWTSQITGKLQLNDFVTIVPSSNRRVSIGKDGVISAREPCWCGFRWTYNLIEDLHLLLQVPSHNYLWVHFRHKHNPDPRNPASSGIVIGEPFCVYLDTSAMARARLGKPYTLQQGVLPDVAADRPHF